MWFLQNANMPSDPCCVVVGKQLGVLIGFPTVWLLVCWCTWGLCVLVFWILIRLFLKHTLLLHMGISSYEIYFQFCCIIFGFFHVAQVLSSSSNSQEHFLTVCKDFSRSCVLRGFTRFTRTSFTLFGAQNLPYLKHLLHVWSTTLLVQTSYRQFCCFSFIIKKAVAETTSGVESTHLCH